MPQARISTCVDLLEDAVGAVAEQLGRDAGHGVERVGDRPRLLEDLLLHVVPVRARARRRRCAPRTVCTGRATSRQVALGVGVDDPVLAELDVDDVAFFQVDDLVGDAGERHRVGGEEGLARAGPLPTPRISGEPWRAPTTRCGSSRQNTAMA